MAEQSDPRLLPRFAAGVRDARRAGYGWHSLGRDLLAGLTLGTVAVPLSMALAIATGVPPQHGLYTAIVAGVVIALCGGSRFNVSGPTAAFVVILYPVVQQYGLSGLLVATVMAGMILVALGMARLGGLIQYVPYPVVLGFTAGIAVVIAGLQIPDFLGLDLEQRSDSFVENLWHIVLALPQLQPDETLVGIWTLAVLLFWPRLRLPIPAPLAGLAAGAMAAWFWNQWGADPGTGVETIASRFTWQAGGESGTGIPPLAPSFVLPWHWPGPEGRSPGLDFELVRSLAGPAFAIAMLGAIESLLCSVVSDGLTRTRHDPDAELIGQGLGNMVAPLFGGITATAALARTATNIRSGARSPLAAVVHSLVVLLAMVSLAGVLGMVPMSALAALLLVVAWNMSEARHFLHWVRGGPAGDVAILLVCFLLTVIFDMVLAVGVGIGLAAVLFIRRMSSLTASERVAGACLPELEELSGDTLVYDLNGPLFFGVAEKAFDTMRIVDPDVRAVILDMRDVLSIDATALAALKNLVDELAARRVAVILVGLAPGFVVKLRRAGIRRTRGRLTICSTLSQAQKVLARWRRTADQWER